MPNLKFDFSRHICAPDQSVVKVVVDPNGSTMNFFKTSEVYHSYLYKVLKFQRSQRCRYLLYRTALVLV